MPQIVDDYVPALVLHADGAETVTGQSEVFKFPYKEAIFTLDVTAVAGTAPTLDLTIEEYDQASDTFTVIETFPQQSGVAFVRQIINEDGALPFYSLLRAVWTIGGSSGQSVTFTATASGKR